MNPSQMVRMVMTKNPRSVDIGATPGEVAALLEEGCFEHLPVLRGGALVGIISASDIARVSLGAWVKDKDTASAWLDSQFRVNNLMTWEPDFVRDNDPISVAAAKLCDATYHCLPVLDVGNKLVGIVTSTDLLRVLAAEAPKE